MTMKVSIAVLGALFFSNAVMAVDVQCVDNEIDNAVTAAEAFQDEVETCFGGRGIPIGASTISNINTQIKSWVNQVEDYQKYKPGSQKEIAAGSVVVFANNILSNVAYLKDTLNLSNKKQRDCVLEQIKAIKSGMKPMTNCELV